MPREIEVARLTVKNASAMTQQGRVDIANWLIDQAAKLVKIGRGYDPKFKAHYVYIPQRRPRAAKAKT